MPCKFKQCTKCKTTESLKIYGTGFWVAFFNVNNGLAKMPVLYNSKAIILKAGRFGWFYQLKQDITPHVSK